ncbi:hypothetical protein [Rhodovulum sp. PH10]|uniref:hypothetical protein n=1 Tax=Rhodovulum sp. PH10 TaxID=1187851 RepID=UPI0012FA8C6C|nr:hypothetical protein [Rhodovulum sp. PH10]
MNDQVIEPGSVRIRPTRAQAEANEEAFYELLNVVRAAGRLKLETIAEVLGKKSSNPAPNMHRRIQN